MPDAGHEASAGPALSPRFFRHVYGHLVAVLSRRFGVAHLSAVEDAVQGALTKAIEAWPRAGAPDDPTAWLYRVAHNAFVGERRVEGRRRELLAERSPDPESPEEPQGILRGEIADDLLRMLFACCAPELPRDSQVVLALKVLCGFDVREIALRLFRSEADVYKRLQRARRRLRDTPGALDALTPGAFRARVPAVQATLYLLFTEGHLSSHERVSLRRELCDEAVRLAELLASHAEGATPSTAALLALMYLHRARLASRLDDDGLVLLADQDRSAWDEADIARGMQWLERSASGEAMSRYHAEASVAAEHALSPSFEATRWDKIARAYALLERLEPSPLHRLNRALATAEAEGPGAGLVLLEGVPPGWLEGSYLWAAGRADLYRRAGDTAQAELCRDAALRLAPSDAVRRALRRRLRVDERPS